MLKKHRLLQSSHRHTDYSNSSSNIQTNPIRQKDFFHSHSHPQTTPILTLTTPILNQNTPILTQTHKTIPIHTQTYQLIPFSLRHTDTHSQPDRQTTFILTKTAPILTQTTPILNQTLRLFPISPRLKDYSQSHPDSQTHRLPFLHRLLQFSLWYTDYYNSHSNIHTNPILSQTHTD